MENQRHIFSVLSRQYSNGSVRYRENRHLSPAIISGAQLLLKKPFLRSWSAVLPPTALKIEEAFVAFWPCIMIVSPDGVEPQRFWDGGGNFLANVKPGVEHRLCGYADLAFSVLPSLEAFRALQPYLERPS